MPINKVLSIYRKWRKFSFDIIFEIHDKFQVSILAALFRIFILNLHPLIIIKSKDGIIQGKPLRNKDFFFALNSKTDLPKESVAFDFFNTQTKYQRTKEMWTLDWFNTDKIQKMYEHCIYYEKQNIVYSILWMD